MFAPPVAKPGSKEAPSPRAAAARRPIRSPLHAFGPMPGRHPSQSHPPIQAKPQTGAAAAPQDSPLAKEVREAWEKQKKIEDVLEILAREDVRKTKDTILDAELVSLLTGRPDDLWLAQRIRQGKLGMSKGEHPKTGKPTKARKIEIHYFPGLTSRRALVIAGVHGSEKQGIEVTRILIGEIEKAARRPYFTTIIAPVLFPDAEKFGIREGKVPTNRNFPPWYEDLAAARAAGGGKPVDASGMESGKRKRRILHENQLLLELKERFNPERIISIHGTARPGAAGVFYDPRTLRPDEVQAARLWAKWMAQAQIYLSRGAILLLPGFSVPMNRRAAHLEQRLFQQRLAELRGEAKKADETLALDAAKQIHWETRSITGRERRKFLRENEEKEGKTLTDKVKEDRAKHGSVAGNVGLSGDIDTPIWSGEVEEGVSLGEYAPPQGISVFTVEPPLNIKSKSYAASDKHSGIERDPAVSRDERELELKAYAEAVRTILLGEP